MAADDGAAAVTPTPGGAAAGSMSAPVTRHAVITGEGDWELVGCGVDSLDVSFCVDWGAVWSELGARLAEKKKLAEDTKGISFGESILGPILIHPKGRQNYAYHLQASELHCWLEQRATADGKPNMLVSFNAETLWKNGVEGACRRLGQLVTEWGGVLGREKVSRADLCADFYIPDGLSEDFLKTHGVCRSPKRSTVTNADKLETYYFGQLGRPLLCRIYHKSIEILKARGKLWLVEVWQRANIWNIWRIEFQLRREPLRQFEVESVSDLLTKAGGLWHYLTDDWLSLRVPDDGNTSRRTILPQWRRVQAVAGELGPAVQLRRVFDSRTRAGADWHVKLIAGHLLSHAALRGHADLGAALRALGAELRREWADRDFAGEYRHKCVKLGLPAE